LILVYARWVTPGALAQDLAASKDQRTKNKVQSTMIAVGLDSMFLLLPSTLMSGRRGMRDVHEARFIARCVQVDASFDPAKKLTTETVLCETIV
jgi:hypothetical protein